LWTAVLGWTLVIKERLLLPPRSAGLFGDHMVWADGDPKARTGDELALLGLENKLKVPLERFALHADWVPEDSYGASGPSTPSSSRDDLEPQTGLRRDSESPLYLYKKPIPFDPRGQSCTWRFLERTMEKWWRSEDRPRQRDYYRLTDGDFKEHWVFKDTQGQAFVHGVYA
jgi:hypothetical protein